MKTKTPDQFIKYLKAQKSNGGILGALQEMPREWSNTERERVFQGGTPTLNIELARSLFYQGGFEWRIWITRHPGVNRETIEGCLGKNLKDFITKPSEYYDWLNPIKKELIGFKDPWTQAMHRFVLKQAKIWTLEELPVKREREMAEMVLIQPDTPLEVLDFYATSLSVGIHPGLGVRCLEHANTTASEAAKWQKYWEKTWSAYIVRALWIRAMYNTPDPQSSYAARLRFIPYELLIEFLTTDSAEQRESNHWPLIFKALGEERRKRLFVDLVPYIKKETVGRGVSVVVKASEATEINNLDKEILVGLVGAGYKDLAIAVVGKLAEARGETATKPLTLRRGSVSEFDCTPRCTVELRSPRKR